MFSENGQRPSHQMNVSMRAFLLRSIVPLTGVVCCIFLLQQRFADIAWLDVQEAVSAISTYAIFLALVLGFFSHLGLAGYDLLAFTRIGRKIPWSRALIGGLSGTVFSQVLGFGLITGSYARRRIYRANDVGLAQAVTLTGFVAAGFFSGLGVLLVVLTLVDPDPVAAITGLDQALVFWGALTLVIAITAVGWLTRNGGIAYSFGRMRIRLPDGAWLAGATLLAAFDLIPAALSLLVLLPDSGMPTLSAFVVIYVIAVASGHVVGSPGAVGPFEAVIFLALPNVPVADLTAAVVVYRVMYYLPPFLMALGCVTLARKVPETSVTTGPELRNAVDWIVDASDNPEAELAYLGDKHIYLPVGATAFVMYGIHGRTWLVLGDPIGDAHAWPEIIDGLTAEARAAGAILAIYKVTDRSKALWEARGYRLDPLGEEGVIDVQNFTTIGSAFRELRRKVSSARKANVVIELFEAGQAPMSALHDVASSWRDEKNGIEQTFSMGHWQTGFTARHKVLVASISGDAVAFLSCWISGEGQEWMIDLMRQQSNTPNGTMHALLVHAIEAARGAGARRLNLCAAPMAGLDKCTRQTAWTRIGHKFYDRLDYRHGLSGVRRFKAAFRPDWSQRYLASRNLLNAVEALNAAYSLISLPGQSVLYETPRSPVLPCPENAKTDSAAQDLSEDTLPAAKRVA